MKETIVRDKEHRPPIQATIDAAHALSTQRVIPYSPGWPQTSKAPPLLSPCMQIHTHGAQLQAKSHCLEFILCSHNVEMGEIKCRLSGSATRVFLTRPSQQHWIGFPSLLFNIFFFEILEYLRLNVIYVLPTHYSLVLMTWSHTPNRHQEV